VSGLLSFYAYHRGMKRARVPLFLLVLAAEIAIVLVASSFYTGQVLMVLISAFSGILLVLVVLGAWWAKRRRLREYRHSGGEFELPGDYDAGPPGWWEQIVLSAIDDLPPELREAMSNVEVIVEDEPPPQPNVLGLYRGVPLTRRGSAYTNVLPDKISIYRGPLERLYGGDPVRLEHEIRHVVVHEIAHHFGISDERLIEMGRY
jgi:predicted Zn-dependent protease with MMP-like domain